MLRWSGGAAAITTPQRVGPSEARYPTPAQEFELSVIRLNGEGLTQSARRGVEIVLCSEGRGELADPALRTAGARSAAATRCSCRPRCPRYRIEGSLTAAACRGRVRRLRLRRACARVRPMSATPQGALFDRATSTRRCSSRACGSPARIATTSSPVAGRACASCSARSSARARILDFGCGTGDTAARLAELYPATRGHRRRRGRRRRSSTRAARTAIARVRFECLDAASSRAAATTSAIRTACSTTSAPAERERRGAARARRALRRGGRFALIENNPWNPGTRLVMRRIPFDRDAIPISPPGARALLRAAGFARCRAGALPVLVPALRWRRLRVAEPVARARAPRRAVLRAGQPGLSARCGSAGPRPHDRDPRAQRGGGDRRHAAALPRRARGDRGAERRRARRDHRGERRLDRPHRGDRAQLRGRERCSASTRTAATAPRSSAGFAHGARRPAWRSSTPTAPAIRCFFGADVPRDRRASRRTSCSARAWARAARCRWCARSATRSSPGSSGSSRGSACATPRAACACCAARRSQHLVPAARRPALHARP